MFVAKAVATDKAFHAAVASPLGPIVTLKYRATAPIATLKRRRRRRWRPLSIAVGADGDASAPLAPIATLKGRATAPIATLKRRRWRRCDLKRRCWRR
nr:hypothetical protein CFP56_10781 [Quercus suber]